MVVKRRSPRRCRLGVVYADHLRPSRLHRRRFSRVCTRALLPESHRLFLSQAHAHLLPSFAFRSHWQRCRPTLLTPEDCSFLPCFRWLAALLVLLVCRCQHWRVARLRTTRRLDRSFKISSRRFRPMHGGPDSAPHPRMRASDCTL